MARGYSKAVARARHLIYIEDQYLWGHEVGEVLTEALRANPDLHVMAVLPLFTDLSPPELQRLALSAPAQALQPLHLWLVPLAGLLAVFGLPKALRKVSGLAWADTAGVVLLLALCLLKVAWGAYSPFLYFRF